MVYYGSAFGARKCCCVTCWTENFIGTVTFQGQEKIGRGRYYRGVWNAHTVIRVKRDLPLLRCVEVTVTVQKPEPFDLLRSGRGRMWDIDIASSNIEPNHCVVHSLGYNFTLNRSYKLKRRFMRKIIFIRAVIFVYLPECLS